MKDLEKQYISKLEELQVVLSEVIELSSEVDFDPEPTLYDAKTDLFFYIKQIKKETN